MQRTHTNKYKKINNKIKNGQRALIDIFSKDTYRWPADT